MGVLPGAGELNFYRIVLLRRNYELLHHLMFGNLGFTGPQFELLRLEIMKTGRRFSDAPLEGCTPCQLSKDPVHYQKPSKKPSKHLLRTRSAFSEPFGGSERVQGVCLRIYLRTQKPGD